MRATIMHTVLWIVAGGMAPTASAQTFAVVANLQGASSIGAIKGKTLYGTTAYGGGSGTLFSLTTAGAYTLLHQFVSATDGSGVNPELALDIDGDVFGMASGGGAQGGGTLWEYGAHGGLSTLHAFGSVPNDGISPLQGPLIAGNSVLFGTTAMGAVSTNGLAFRAVIGGKYSALHDFLSGTDGHCPFSGVARDGDGNLYGTTVGRGFGGNPNGSVWKITAKGVFSTLYIFKNGSDGEWPDQAPVSDSAGNIYGTTHILNGNNFDGAIWTISKTGVFSVLHDFVSATDGSVPDGPLTLARDGNLYGTTANGGAGGYGTAFSITPGGVFKVLHPFANGTDGANPTGTLATAGLNTIYGGTGTGTVFRIVP